jgi:ketosteroid isomerase-like protein
MLRNMTFIFPLAFATLVPLQMTKAQSPHAGSTAQNLTSAQLAAEKYIREGEARWTEAIVSGDVSIAQRILADDFVGVDPSDGHLYDKREEISSTRQERSRYISDHLTNVKIRFFGNTAIAQGSESWVRRTGEPRRGRFVWTDIWVLRNGRWRIVAAEDMIAPPLATKSAK